MKKNKSFQWLLLMFLTGAVFCPTAALATESWGIDPYQNVYDDEKVKVYFLKRIANDTNPEDPIFPLRQPNVPMNWTIYSPDTSRHPKGKFLYAENSSELEQLFIDVAKKIKLKLVQ